MPPLPGCEATAEVRKILDEELDTRVLDRMKFPDRLAHERRVLKDLIARYPRELEPHDILRSRLSQYAPDEYQAVRMEWVRMAKDNPDDPLALLLGSYALHGKGTPEAIRLLEAAKTKAPNFAWPARQLAGIYRNGKHADPKKAKQNLETFFAICPASTDGYAQWLLLNDPGLQRKAAAALRARLEEETDPRRLKEYRTLWSQEFRTRPPQEHSALRAQIARDLKRLETLNPKGGPEWQALVINGYKQSGASKEEITTLEDRLVREYAKSSEAYRIVRGRWAVAHQEPVDQSDTVAWARYRKDFQEALKGWVSDYPDDTYLQREAWFYAIQDDDAASKEDGIAAVDTFLQYVREYKGSTRFWFYFPDAAEFLIERGWQPARALGLLNETRTLTEIDRARRRDDDNLTDDELTSRRNWQFEQDQILNGLTLRAAMQAQQPAEALKLRTAIETPPPTDKKLQSAYWRNRARFEAIQNHVQDALAYYQLALHTRTDPPKPLRGKLRDELTAEARAMWKAQGGTETAWAVWSKPASSGTEQPAEGRWEKPAKAIPLFELPDLSGKIWRLKELGGKALLINVWATWCGPCQAELPHLQKFYERVKSRSDIQVLTFNIDENLGVVAPYLKEKGYTFPVLPANSVGIAGDDGIPQTWILDSRGISRWKLSGYVPVSYAEFEKSMLERLEADNSSR